MESSQPYFYLCALGTEDQIIDFHKKTEVPKSNYTLNAPRCPFKVPDNEKYTWKTPNFPLTPISTKNLTVEQLFYCKENECDQIVFKLSLYEKLFHVMMQSDHCLSNLTIVIFQSESDELKIALDFSLDFIDFLSKTKTSVAMVCDHNH